MRIAITPISYRAGFGTGLEILEFRGNPPTTVTWQIVTDTGYVLERGEVEMSRDDWDNWPAGEDNNYAEKIVAGYLGVAVA